MFFFRHFYSKATFSNILSCSYRLDEAEFLLISNEAKDFIRKLLVIDQDIRMSAEQVNPQPQKHIYEEKNNNLISASEMWAFELFQMDQKSLKLRKIIR